VEFLGNNALYMMERSMDFLWTKQTAILDNLSNVETPNYKTKYVTFEEALRQRLEGYEHGGLSTRRALESVSPVVHVATNETAKADGNGVNATEQGVELSRNALQLQAVFGAINSDLALLRSAIQGQ